MRKATFLATAAIIFLGNAGVFADEFGSRFNDQTPPGLADYTVEETPDIAMDKLVENLQNIKPAAGETKSELKDPELKENVEEKKATETSLEENTESYETK